MLDADDSASASNLHGTHEQPGTGPSQLPPVPPPATPPQTTLPTAPASAQVEAVRTFLHGHAGESPAVPEVARKTETVPAVFFGLGSTVILTGYLENTHLNGLRGTVTQINDQNSYNVQLPEGTSLNGVPVMHMRPAIGDHIQSSNRQNSNEYVPLDRPVHPHWTT